MKALKPDNYTTVKEMAEINHSNRLLSFFVLHFSRLSGDVVKANAFIDKNGNAYLSEPKGKQTKYKSIYILNEQN